MRDERARILLRNEIQAAHVVGGAHWALHCHGQRDRMAVFREQGGIDLHAARLHGLALHYVFDRWHERFDLLRLSMRAA